MLDGVVAAALEHVERAGHVAAHVGVRFLQRVAHARLCREVNDARKFLARKERTHRIVVREVQLLEAEVGLCGEPREPCLLQRDVIVLVEIVQTHHLVAAGQQLVRGVRPNESRRTGHQYLHRRPSTALAGNTCLMSYTT